MKQNDRFLLYATVSVGVCVVFSAIGAFLISKVLGCFVVAGWAFYCAYVYFGEYKEPGDDES